jgi:WD40 repeat protein
MKTYKPFLLFVVLALTPLGAVQAQPAPAENWGLLRTLSGHGEFIALSPDGSRIVFGSDDDTIKVWNAGE